MAKAFEFKVDTTAELKRKLKLLGPTALKAAGQSLYLSGEVVMTKSKETYVPVDTGNLRDSGNVALPEISGSEVSVVLGYGNAAVGYAIYVHETPKNYRNGRQWKYLETPLKESLPDIGRELALDLDEAFSEL